MNRSSMLSVFLVLLFAYTSAMSNRLCAQPAKSPLNLSKPETWEKEVQNAKENLARITVALTFVASDKTRSPDDRRKAILLLGQIDNKDSVEYLVSNIALELPLADGTDDDAKLRQRPCVLALATSYKGRWKAAKVVLKALESSRSEKQLENCAEALKRMVGVNVALIFVEGALTKARSDHHKSNLEFVKKAIPK